MNLRKRVDRLVALAPPGCPDAFHVTYHVVMEDPETGELPPCPRCPVCGAEAQNVIEVVCSWREVV